jgi:hypothetical protein
MTGSGGRGEINLARKKKMTLVPGARPQLRKRAARDWSTEKSARFLDALMETCNVSEACRRSGVPMTVAYRRRKMDAKFRARWADMIAIAYSRLELVLLDRALNGTEKVTFRRDGSEERIREYPNHIALRLLQMHRETMIEADSQLPPDDIAEIRERIVRKLQRMKKRDEAEEAGSRELRGGDGPCDGGAEGSEGGASAPRD